jgi:hypothetical protein
LAEGEETATGLSRVAIAFAKYRAAHGPARLPRGTEPGDLTLQMTPEDGLSELVDGPDDAAGSDAGATLEADWQSVNLQLWAIRMEDVVHAPESCEFGLKRAAGVVKHTNLTGGAPAYAAGEIIFVNPSHIVINGFSGRYRVRSSEAMTAVEIAFKESGYHVWSTGWDADAGMGLKFGTVLPQKVK